MKRVGGDTIVTSGLDKVFTEVGVLRRLSASSKSSAVHEALGHPNVIALRQVLADPSSDDLYLG